jgi:hypothetical protein
MNVKEVRHRVAEIAAMAGDDEAAHSAEDGLHQAVLSAIANGAEDAPSLAYEALKTGEIAFCRWRA